nr:hypothetical protein [uncultured Actinomyces sp.]
MSENEFDVHRGNDKDARDNVVLTGEEIELPGDGSDAAAIIGEASEPINTGEIESVAIGGLTGRVPGAAPLKPTIEDKISTGELPVVSAPSVPSDEADFASASEVEPVDASFEAPQADAGSEHEADAEPVAEEPSEVEAPAVEAPAVEAPAVEESAVEAAAEESAVAEPSQVDVPTAKAHVIEEPSQVDVPTAKARVIKEPADEAPVAEEEFSSSEPVRSPIMTPAQAAAALGLNLDSAREDRVEPQAAAPVAAEEPAPIEDAPEHSAEASSHGDERASAVGGAAAEAAPSLPSRRSMIFGDDEPFSPSIPALSPAAQEARAAESAQEAVDEAQASSTVDVPTKKLPNYKDGEESAYTDVPTRKLSTRLAERMATTPSYSFDEQDEASAQNESGDGAAAAVGLAAAGAAAAAGASALAEEERPQRRSVLGTDEDDRDAATLAAIASQGRDRGDKAPASRLDDELFSATPEITEMPSRGGAHFLSFLLFLILVPVGWYLAADAGSRMTLSEAAPMFTGVASILALGELLGAIVITVILCATARRSSLGAWFMGVITLLAGLPWVLTPGITASTLLDPLTVLANTSSFGSNLAHHLQASGYSGRFALLAIVLMGLGYVSHSARRKGRAEEALRTSIEAINPAGAFYSKGARKKAAKDLKRK